MMKIPQGIISKRQKTNEQAKGFMHILKNPKGILYNFKGEYLASKIVF